MAAVPLPAALIRRAPRPHADSLVGKRFSASPPYGGSASRWPTDSPVPSAPGGFGWPKSSGDSRWPSSSKWLPRLSLAIFRSDRRMKKKRTQRKDGPF